MTGWLGVAAHGQGGYLYKNDTHYHIVHKSTSNACQLQYFTVHTTLQNNVSITLLHACHLSIMDTCTCCELSSNLPSTKTRKQLKALTVSAEKASATFTISLVAVMLIICLPEGNFIQFQYRTINPPAWCLDQIPPWSCHCSVPADHLKLVSTAHWAT